MDIKVDKIDKNIFFTAGQIEDAPDNFFVFNKNKQTPNEKNTSGKNYHRLNDYDSKILEDSAYQKMSDEMLKIEYKMGTLEKALSKINQEIDILKTFEETFQVNSLIENKQLIEEEIEELNKKYSELGISAKISGQITSVINFSSNKRPSGFSKIGHFISTNILSKISKKFLYSQRMKDALKKLSGINHNVDELITMNTPYGETFNRYEKLTAYLNKANSIHAQISKNWKNIK